MAPLKNICAALLLISAVALLQPASAEDSFIKMRFYKGFITDFFQKNLKIIFTRLERFQVRDIELADLNTKMTNVRMTIAPRSADYNDMNVEVFFDAEERLIMIELHDLELSGNALVWDPNTEARERVEFWGPLSAASITLRPEEEMDERRNMFPRFAIHDVSLVTQPHEVVVSAFGDLPLYKSHKFEASIKKWFVEEITKKKTSLVEQLAEFERRFWTNFRWVYPLFNGVRFESSLADQIGIQEDYIELGVMSEIHGVDHNEFKFPLRKIAPTFRADAEYKQGMQLVFDENFWNHLFLGFFHNNKEYSLRELLPKLVPDQFSQYVKLAQTMISTSTVSYLLPDLLKEFEQGKQVDLKCGFSQGFLAEKFNDVQVSQIKFLDDNTFKYNFGFGCGIFVNSAFSFESDLARWEPWRYFFFAVDGFFQFDFGHADLLKRITASLRDGKVNVQHLKIFKGKEEVTSEEKYYEEKITQAIDKARQEDGNFKLPIVPYPRITECWGISPISPNIEIVDGFVRVSFDFDVKEGDERCFFYD